MPRPRTVPAFTDQEYQQVHALLAAKVAFMMGRKLEEGDWADIYCRAKDIPNSGWSNLRLDVMHNGLGIEHKMLRYESRADISEACGKTLMHPSATRSLRMPPPTVDADVAMRDVLSQYAAFIEARRAKVRETLPGAGEPDLRVGWLLWQSGLRQFLYFEEEMLPPNPDDYYAEWISRAGQGARKSSTNLWIYEQGTRNKRYSVTNEAGAKIQPYFDVPPIDDPSLYIFTVIGEELDGDQVRVWMTDATARDLALQLGSLDSATLSRAMVAAAAEIARTGAVEHSHQEVAHPFVVPASDYAAIRAALPGVNDDAILQRLAQYLRSQRVADR